MSDSLRLHGLQQARPLHHQLPELTQTHVHWVITFSSHLQSFPASGSFPRSRRFTSDGQSIGTSASASLRPVNIQGWFPLGLTGLISLKSKGLWRVFSNTTVQMDQFFSTQLLYSSTLTSIHDYWKNHWMMKMQKCFENHGRKILLSGGKAGKASLRRKKFS